MKSLLSIFRKQSDPPTTNFLSFILFSLAPLKQSYKNATPQTNLTNYIPPTHPFTIHPSIRLKIGTNFSALALVTHFLISQHCVRNNLFKTTDPPIKLNNNALPNKCWALRLIIFSWNFTRDSFFFSESITSSRRCSFANKLC